MTRKAAVILLLLMAAAIPSAKAQVTSELDAYWAALARSVAAGDFEGYAAGYHEDAVVVSLARGISYPIGRALAGWKQGFDDTRDGRLSAGVEFRLTRRLNDTTTAHETGMFRYFSQLPGREVEVGIFHFEALLVKKNGVWLMVMEYQKEPATTEEWEAAGSGRRPVARDTGARGRALERALSRWS